MRHQPSGNRTASYQAVPRRPLVSGRRRGAFVVLGIFCLVVCMCFAAMSIDTGNIALNKTFMQNAVDTAALAAAMEITHAVGTAPPEVADPTAYAKAQARQKAVDVAALNDVFVHSNADIQFGRRFYDEDTESYVIEWGGTPTNAVKVTARREDPDISKPDGQLPLMFAGVLGDSMTTMRADAVAYVEARDIAIALDFSGSMRFDSMFRQDTISKLGQPAIEANLEDGYNALGLDLGSMGFTPSGFTVYSPPSEIETDPVVEVTFRYGEIDVVSDQVYDQVKLDFTDGMTETIDVNESTGTYAGSGANEGKNIDTAWVIFVQEDVMVNGDDGSGCQPTITATFNGDGTSIYIESTKDLSNVVLEFADGSHYKFDGLSGQTGTFAGIGEDAGKQIVGVWVKSGCNASGDGPGYGERFDSPLTGQTSIALEFNDTNDNAMAFFELDQVTYAYPQGSWDEFLTYVRNDADIDRAGYRELYGGLTFVHYLIDMRYTGADTPDLWKVPHYPFHAVKQGTILFTDYLSDLDFGDYVGLVSYDSYSRAETTLFASDATVDISANPLGQHYEEVATLIEHKQAGQYYSSTNIGGGIREARQMLNDHGRAGALPTLLVMTDGNPTVYEDELGNLNTGDYWQLPADWDWSDFEYPDGTSYQLDPADGAYAAKCFALKMAKQAVDDGMVIHTMTVGNGADEALMKAIAWMGRGEFISVDGGTTVTELEDAVRDAFYRIATLVPTAHLEKED